jgi:uroporphyrinogen-III synthase
MLAALEGFAVGITADRRADEQADLLRRRGATVFHGPVIETLPLEPDGALRAATRAVLDEPPAYVVANTGIGVRGWFTAAETWGWDGELAAVLAAAKVVARGPKAAGALHAFGIDVWWRAPDASLAEVTARLLDEPVAGCRIAFQRHGAADDRVGADLRTAGADVVEIPVYRWTLPETRDRPHALVDRVCSGDVDAVTFTSAPAVDNLFAIAADRGREDDVRAALNGRVVAAVVGPYCAAAARDRGLDAVVEPRAARLGSMVRSLTERLAEQRAVVPLDRGQELVVQGRAAALRTPDDVDGPTVQLPTRERWVLARLVDARGTVVGRADLVRAGGWSPGDDHVLDVTIGRLRRRLGAAGRVVETVPKRGYRIAAEPHTVRFGS